MSSKKITAVIIILMGIGILVSVVYTHLKSIEKVNVEEAQRDSEMIKVGLLFSSTGISANVERSMINAARLAFSEINEAGGVGGKKIEYVERDYSSDPSLAKKQIEKLITEDKVVATVGCYTSASRKATLPVLEKYDSLLVYPTYTEGEEVHPNVIYTGAMPNQQATEYIPWLMNKHGKRVFMIGSDYVFPVTCNKQAKKIIEQNGGTICGELYAETGRIDFSDMFRQIKEADPDFIYCDLVGDSVIAFYREYQKSGMSVEDCPIASITTDEMTLSAIGAECAEGHYASMNYFSTLDTPKSREFVEKYREFVNDGSDITCLAESTYNSCHLLAKAMKKVENSYDAAAMIEAFSGLSFDAPQGTIHVDEENHCTWLHSRFAVAREGSFEIVYESEDAIKPEPWPEVQ